MLNDSGMIYNFILDELLKELPLPLRFTRNYFIILREANENV